MLYAIIAIICLTFCILLALLDEVLRTGGLKRRIGNWFRNFKGVING